ncbi:protein TolQ [Salinisphaera hydrothermalis]|uniref:Tol-Pal system protein TolQ n=1 Tax=Salinisphaera hydrothermalis (strain C41B8) TaxID=1304275 RepID=A0A084IKK2_SALHC|nr:protein TolQ [Salinisphaera hydrothermalis]KEZ77236.1 protein TolQ [Salinisphaera hydrothermalis C41B8]
MNVATDMSLVSLIMQASTLVKAVLVILLLASIASWVVIFAKRRLMKNTVAEMEWFEDRFWSGGNVKDIYEEVHRHDEHPEGMPALFKAGYEELKRQRNQGDAVSSSDIVPSVQRAMRVALSRELERLESGLAFLATVGSISPYVGLFGTVWGIMSAFIGLGNVQQASLSMVAPGIAEALIATAMGLFAAIPAVVAYNFFSNRLEFIENRFDTFMEEMAGIVERGVNAANPIVRERAAKKADKPEPVRTAPEL